MENLYIIVAVQQEGLDDERVSVEYRELYNSGLTVGEFLNRYGSFQREWSLIDVWTGGDPQGMIVTYWN